MHNESKYFITASGDGLVSIGGLYESNADLGDFCLDLVSHRVKRS
jgi:hypothetical protein